MPSLSPTPTNAHNTPTTDHVSLSNDVHLITNLISNISPSPSFIPENQTAIQVSPNPPPRRSTRTQNNHPI